MFDVSKVFSKEISHEILKYNLDELEEIRLRVNREIILRFREEERVLNYFVSQADILQVLQVICDNSIYSFQNQICNGFITINRAGTELVLLVMLF